MKLPLSAAEPVSSAAPLSGLLTGRALVGRLAELGVGTWTADAVRQWIREEPPLPIASPAQQGQPHRYRLEDALAWLQARAQRERAKGYTSADGTRLTARIEAAMLRLSGGGGEAGAVDPPVDVAPPPSREPQQLTLGAVAPAKPAAAPPPQFSEEELAQLTDLELVIGVLKGRDPRNWESTERALRLRRENRVDEGKFVPVEDLEDTLATMALAMRSAASALVAPLAMRIPDVSTFSERSALIRSAINDMLSRLAREETDALAASGADAQ